MAAQGILTSASLSNSFLHPVTYGNYPPIMRGNVGKWLPEFSEAQSKMLKGSYDFVCINYYTSNYASPVLSANRANLSYTTDDHVDLTTLKDEVRIRYYEARLWYLQKAIKDTNLVSVLVGEDANVKEHFVWSSFDDFEWDAGFTVPFGMFYVDYKDGLKRYPKHSALWFKKFLHEGAH
ncbi:hypothetical protein RJ639_007816 [Escallonia herrerae]|uniref:Beta-glucosidase n=1 Tax=Escallonia herrerae TaxID=1293975 RepID=A0AA89AUM3_9ASTE|nr:hypothetical protein RJ639_007816 [Escallonia herrerae]